MIWFADTQKWDLALETDKADKVITGSKENLVNAIRIGSAVRCVTGDGFYAFPAENIAIDITSKREKYSHIVRTSANVAVQTLNQISTINVCISLYLLFANFKKKSLNGSSESSVRQKSDSQKALLFQCFQCSDVFKLSTELKAKMFHQMQQMAGNSRTAL